MFRSDIEFTIDVADDQTYQYFDIIGPILERHGLGSTLSFNEQLNRKLFDRAWKSNLKHQIEPGRYRVKTVRNCLNFSAVLHPSWL